MSNNNSEQRVSMTGLNPAQALRALLAVERDDAEPETPQAETEAEPEPSEDEK